MNETTIIDRVLGTIVGMILGAMGGAVPTLWSQTVAPGYGADWYQWAVLIATGAIAGALAGFLSGLKAVFDWRWYSDFRPPTAGTLKRLLIPPPPSATAWRGTVPRRPRDEA